MFASMFGFLINMMKCLSDDTFAWASVPCVTLQDYKFPKETWSSVSLRGQAIVSTMLCAPPRLRPDMERLIDHGFVTDPDRLPTVYLSALGTGAGCESLPCVAVVYHSPIVFPHRFCYARA
eukprot:TRINITY_DN6291_c0_g1_i4.p2 TRINITY_DN6291_c0_g1~~TRINITY_DN6291_c0_g1_i4.p2  ORF type:complete len:121 (+),score=3.06 TRINITY_DN6291_c0_g1_i4:195-557(+)